MLLDVLDHAVPAAEAGAAVRAVERRLPGVAQQVPGQVLGPLEGRVALRAGVRPLAEVLGAAVQRQRGEVGQVQAAGGALELPYPCRQKVRPSG